MQTQLQEDVRIVDVNLLKWKLLIEEVFNYFFLYFRMLEEGYPSYISLYVRINLNYKFWKQTINKNVVNT